MTTFVREKFAPTFRGSEEGLNSRCVIGKSCDLLMNKAVRVGYVLAQPFGRRAL